MTGTRVASFVFILLFSATAFALSPRYQFDREIPRKILDEFFHVSEKKADALNNVLPDKPYVVLDFETTGLDRNGDGIIEMAAYKFQGTKLIGVFYKMLYPGDELFEKYKADPEARDKSKIDWRDLEGKPSFKEVLPEFIGFIVGAQLVGQNIRGYDWPVFNQLAEKEGLPFGLYLQSLDDTLKMARVLIRRPEVQRYQLESLIQYVEKKTRQTFSIRPNHSAAYDAAATVKLYWYLKFMEHRMREFFISRIFDKDKKIGQKQVDEVKATIRPLLDFLQKDTLKDKEFPETDVAIVVVDREMDSYGVRKLFKAVRNEKIAEIRIYAYKPSHFLSKMLELISGDTAATEESLALFVKKIRIFQKPGGYISQQMELILKDLEDNDISYKNLLFMGEDLLHRRQLQSLKKLLEGKEVTLHAFPAIRKQLSSYKTYKSSLKKFFDLALAMLKNYDQIIYQMEEGEIATPWILNEVKSSYSELIEFLNQPKKEPLKEVESSI